MPTFLDLRTAQFNVAAPGTTIAVTPAAPLYVSSIGLIVNNATNIRVDLSATIGVSNDGPGNLANTITMFIVRTGLAGLTNFAAGTVVASQTFILPAGSAAGTVTSFTMTAADFNPTPSDPGQLTYELFVQEGTLQGGSTAATLVGYQSFEGVAGAG